MDFKDKMYYVGENLRIKREEKDYSRKDVQDIAGISQQYLGEIERGEGNPTLDILYRLSDVYNISIAELIGDKTVYNEKISTLLSKYNFTQKQDILRLLNVLELLNKYEIELLIRLIKEFKKQPSV
jgi:transcriptional regulator with XRE-family HTH domain